MKYFVAFILFLCLTNSVVLAQKLKNLVYEEPAKKSARADEKLPPVNPNLCRLVIKLDPELASVPVVVNKKKYLTDKKGMLPVIDLKENKAEIVIKHFAYQEVNETVALEKGKAVIKVIKLIAGN